MIRALTVLSLIAFAAPMAAQRPEGREGQRAELEARFRQAFARVVKERVGLSDDQMRRLGPINERFSDDRRRLQMDERQSRLALQRALRTPEVADTADVSRLLDRLLTIQQRRVELLRAEQKELSAVMSPIQRARYMALQEQVRRQVEQRAQRGGAAGGAGGRGGGGGPPRRGPPPV